MASKTVTTQAVRYRAQLLSLFTERPAAVMSIGIQLLAYVPVLAVCIAAIILGSLNMRVALLPCVLVLFGVVMMVVPTVVLTLAQYY